MKYFVDYVNDSIKLVTRFWGYAGDRIPGQCWNWRAGIFANGYGQFRWSKRKVKAHRVAWQLVYGPIPTGKIICHTCDNKRCVNPMHLFIGTHKDNAVDRERKGRGGDGGSKTKKEIGAARGAKNPASKITPLIVKTIRKYRRGGHTYSALQEGIEFSFGVKISKSQIANIVHKRSWLHVK